MPPTDCRAKSSGVIGTTLRGVYAYSAYGEVATLGPDGGNDLQYAGLRNDGAGLYHATYRYYDPVLKQWISDDPIGLRGGTNLRSYVLGNPIGFSDPLGLATYGLEIYLFGVGGGINFHTCNGTLNVISLRAGKGIGIQATVDPLGTAPGAVGVAGGNSSLGFYGTAGAGWGPAGVGINANLGMSSNLFRDDGQGGGVVRGYGDVGIQTPIGVQGGGHGRYGAAAAAGFEGTLHLEKCGC